MVKCPKCEHRFLPPQDEEEPPPRREPAERPDEDESPRRPAREPRLHRGDADERRSRDRDDRISDRPGRYEDEDRPARRRYDAEDEDRRARRREDDEDEDAPRRRGRYRDDWGDYDDRDSVRRHPLSNDYDIDLGEWFRHGKEHWSAFLGPCIGFLLILGVMGGVSGAFSSCIPIFGLFVNLALNIFVVNPLSCGLQIVALAQLKGQRWSFGDFFSPFNRYGHYLVLVLLAFVIGIVCYIPTVAGVVVMVLLSPGGPNPLGIVALSAGILATLCLAIFAYTRLGTFAVPLMADREYGPIEALAGSWQLSRGHFWGLLGVNLLLGLINLGGLLLCYIGALFTVPLTTLVSAAGYLLVAGSRPPISLTESDRFERRRRRDRYEDEEDEYEDEPRRRRSRRRDDDDDY
jgi:hypothetical protein